MALDAVTRETVLRSLRTTVEATWKRLIAETAEVAGRGGDVTLGRFLSETGRELEDIYRNGSGSRLRADAGIATTTPTDTELEVAHDLRHLLHVDDPRRLALIDEAMASDGASGLVGREALMLGYQLVHESRRTMAADDVLPWLRGMPAVRGELRALATILADRVAVTGEIRPVSGWPLVLHRHYARREIVTACGYWTAQRKVPRAGAQGRALHVPRARPPRASEGSRPVGIAWRLAHPMPAALFQEYATLAGG